MKLYLIRILALSVVAGAVPAFAQDPTGTQPQPVQPTTPPTTQPGAMQGQLQNDNQIAAVLRAANKAEVKLADYAAKRTKNDDVKTYAERVATDYKGIDKNFDDLLGRINIKPQDAELGTRYTQNADATLALWRDMSDAEFDKAYIDHEVSFHQQFVDTFDQQIVPNVKNSDLKTMVMSVRPTYVAHLDQAKRLQSRLVGS